MLPSLLEMVSLMAFFSSTSVVGEFRYTRDFKSPAQQKFCWIQIWWSWGPMNLTTSIYHSVFDESYQQEHHEVVCNVGRGAIFMKLTTGKAYRSCNAGTTWSRKSVKYSSAVTVRVFLPDTRKNSSKNIGRRIKDEVKPHQTDTWRECSSWLWYSRGFDIAQIRLLWIFMSPCSEKWASFIYMTFGTFVRAPM